jgi:hypothetical protein
MAHNSDHAQEHGEGNAMRSSWRRQLDVRVLTGNGVASTAIACWDGALDMGKVCQVIREQHGAPSRCITVIQTSPAPVPGATQARG